MPVVEHNDDEQKHNSSFKLIYTYNWSQIFLFIVCSLESLFNTLLFVLNKLKFLWFYPVCELQRYSHFLDDPFPRPTSGCTSIYNAGSPEKYVLKTNLNGLLFFFSILTGFWNIFNNIMQIWMRPRLKVFRWALRWFTFHHRRESQ